MRAIVPLKSPERAKSRLAGVLDAAQRRTLFFELAARAIDALHELPAIEEVIVVSASAEVAAFARAHGATPLHEAHEHGTAAAFATAIAQQPAAARLLLLAGDLPLVTPQALAPLCADGDEVIVVPDRHGSGTNALRCPPLVAPCFGADSFQRHLAAAEAAGLPAQVLRSEALSLDLDTPADLEWLQRLGASLPRALTAAATPLGAGAAQVGDHGAAAPA